MRKVWKTYQSSLCIVREMIVWSIEQWRRLIYPYGSNLASEVEDIIGDQVRGFLGLGCHWRECKSLRERNF